MQLVIEAKLGQPVVRNAVAAYSEQEDAEDIADRAARESEEDMVDKVEKADEATVNRVSAYTIDDRSIGKLIKGFMEIGEPAVVRGISTPDYLSGERYSPARSCSGAVGT